MQSQKRRLPAPMPTNNVVFSHQRRAANLVGHFRSGRADPARWQALDDAAVIAKLIEVRGIGRWTAEMLLIFNLMRPDVFPLDDLGLSKAHGWLITREARSPGSGPAESRLSPSPPLAGPRWR